MRHSLTLSLIFSHSLFLLGQAGQNDWIFETSISTTQDNFYNNLSDNPYQKIFFKAKAGYFPLGKAALGFTANGHRTLEILIESTRLWYDISIGGFARYYFNYHKVQLFASTQYEYNVMYEKDDVFVPQASNYIWFLGGGIDFFLTDHIALEVLFHRQVWKNDYSHHEFLRSAEKWEFDLGIRFFLWNYMLEDDLKIDPGRLFRKGNYRLGGYIGSNYQDRVNRFELSLLPELGIFISDKAELKIHPFLSDTDFTLKKYTTGLSSKIVLYIPLNERLYFVPSFRSDYKHRHQKFNINRVEELEKTDFWENGFETNLWYFFPSFGVLKGGFEINHSQLWDYNDEPNTNPDLRFKRSYSNHLNGFANIGFEFFVHPQISFEVLFSADYMDWLILDRNQNEFTGIRGMFGGRVGFGYYLWK